MKKVAIIGLFCSDKGVADGQTIKTNIVTEEIERKLGKENVLRINTFGWKRNPFSLALKCSQAVHRCENVIFMTDAGGIKVFPFLLNMANLRGKCKLHYVVIGGWLPSFLEGNKMVSALLKRFDGIYVEAEMMKKCMLRLGFDNVYVMPNCKNLVPLTEAEIVRNIEEPFKLCTFSRVMKEKGIGEAVEAIHLVNEYYGRTVCTLDIYGQVDGQQGDWFDALSEHFASTIKYCGVVPFDSSVEVLKEYTALLFPTYYDSEGFAGTIIDAFCSGIPVIASRWKYNTEILVEGREGFFVNPQDANDLANAIIKLLADTKMMYAMKKNCLRRANDYIPENAMRVLWGKICHQD